MLVWVTFIQEMPELPEVEAARRAIEVHCVGRKIVKVIVSDDPKVIIGVSSTEFQTSVLGKTIVASLRKGKNLWLPLDSPPFPSFQFGMAGVFYVNGVAVTKLKRYDVDTITEWPSKYSKVFMVLDDGLELSFTDKRRFAKVRLLNDPKSVPPISELGPDALLDPMQEGEFVNLLSKRKIGIKALLLDQSYISGIGNWIADEVLYQAKIHPLQIASELSRGSSELLCRHIKEVIQYAVTVDADCSRFPAEWLFHLRWGKKPGKIKGQRIDFILAGGRTSAFVPEVQKLTLKLGPSKSRKSEASREVATTIYKDHSLKDTDDKEERSTGKESQVKVRCVKVDMAPSTLKQIEARTDSKVTTKQDNGQGKLAEEAGNEADQPLRRKRKKEADQKLRHG